MKISGHRAGDALTWRLMTSGSGMSRGLRAECATVLLGSLTRQSSHVEARGLRSVLFRGMSNRVSHPRPPNDCTTTVMEGRTDRLTKGRACSGVNSCQQTPLPFLLLPVSSATCRQQGQAPEAVAMVDSCKKRLQEDQCLANLGLQMQQSKLHIKLLVFLDHLLCNYHCCAICHVMPCVHRTMVGFVAMGSSLSKPSASPSPHAVGGAWCSKGRPTREKRSALRGLAGSLPYSQRPPPDFKNAGSSWGTTPGYKFRAQTVELQRVLNFS